MICVTIVNVALPSLQRGLGASDRDIQWVLASYALTYGLLLIPAGRAGDLFGHARVFRLGLGLFTSAALLAAFATTPPALIGTRILMGIGAGLFNPQVIGLIQLWFPPTERARAFGRYGAVTAVGAAIGPVLGGVLLTLPADVGWRATFAINVPIGAVALVLALRWLPRIRMGYARSRADLDPLGVLLLAAATACLMVPFITRTWWLLAGTIVLGLAFVGWERAYARRGRTPMVDLRLFSIRSFSAGVAVFTFFLTGTVNVYVIQTLFIQQGLGRSALLAGLVSLPPALVTAWGSALGSRLVERLGARTVPLGLVILLAGIGATIAVMFPIAAGASVWWNALTMSVLGVGMGMVMSAAQTLAMADVPPAAGGTAGGILQTGQRVGSAVGMAMIPGIWFATRGLGPAVAHAWAYATIGAFALLALLVALVVTPGSGQ